MTKFIIKHKKIVIYGVILFLTISLFCYLFNPNFINIFDKKWIKMISFIVKKKDGNSEKYTFYIKNVDFSKVPPPFDVYLRIYGYLPFNLPLIFKKYEAEVRNHNPSFTIVIAEGNKSVFSFMVSRDIDSLGKEKTDLMHAVSTLNVNYLFWHKKIWSTDDKEVIFNDINKEDILLHKGTFILTEKFTQDFW